MALSFRIRSSHGLKGNVGSAVARTVHVVDDDDAVRDSLRALLESYGLLVRDYASGNDFLQEFSGFGAVCLVLDIHMPGITGFELLEILKARNVQIPVIVITGRADSRLRGRLAQTGAVAVLEKPIDEDELIRAIEAAFAE